MYLLIGIFAIIPLIFSHTFARFWADFIIDNGIGHFESLKMHIFLLLLTFAWVEMMIQKWTKSKSFTTKKYPKIALFLSILILFIGIILYPHETLRDLFFGIWEKQHGLLLPLGLIWLGVLLSFLEKSEMRKISYTIVFAWSLVALVALIESMGYNIFTWSSYEVQWNWWEVRSTSTLGNPNYVAWYLLMILPILLGTIESRSKYILFVLITTGIVATKSIIAMGILWGYILFLLVERLYPKKTLSILPSIIAILSIGAYIFYYGTEKWLSLSSRFILMKHTLIGGFDSLSWIIFWDGPDAIIRLFSLERAGEIDAYFPPNMIVDSSHNIFIDFFSMYGLIGVGISITFLISRWRYLDSTTKHGLILWLSFLSLNVFVIAHMMLLVFFLELFRKEKI